MLIACDNKGCMEQTDAKLNVESLDVICTECRKPIRNVSEMMKRVLKSSGQIVRDESRQAFMMACMACNANRKVVLNKQGKTVCNVCKSGINVHPAMKLAIEAAGTRLQEDDSA